MTFDKGAVAYGRSIIVVLAAVVLFARMPVSFISPQLWAEDGVVFRDVFQDGVISIFYPLAGYLVLVTRLAGWLCSFAGPQSAPMLFSIASAVICLFVVFLVTSPRFPFPHKGLLALAVVAVPAGATVLGVIANSQWVIPVGMVAIILMRPPASRMVVAGEAFFIALGALNGPFSILLTPIVGALWYWSNEAERPRLALFFGLLFFGAAIQLLVVWTNLTIAALLNAAPVNEELFAMLRKAPSGARGAINGATLVLVVGAAVYALRQPMRREKLFLFSFVLLTILAAMVKQRADFATIVVFNPRYIYGASVFIAWLAVALLPAFFIYPFFLLATGLTIVLGEQRERIEFDWPAFAAQVRANYVPSFPVAPGWLITNDR